MLCHNCSYILSGKENFCPNCGTMPYGQINETVKKETETKETEIKTEPASLEFYPPYYPHKVVPPAKSTDIFDENEEKEEPEEKPASVKNPVGKIFVLLFITCTLAVTAFGLADYFGITKTVSAFVQNLSQKESTVSENAGEVFRHEMSIVAPDINYSMTTAYILSGTGLTLRKGPSNSYAPVYSLTDLTKVQIFGGSMINRSWVYVYCPEKESYGWLDGSFLGAEPYEETTLYADNSPVVFYS